MVYTSMEDLGHGVHQIRDMAWCTPDGVLATYGVWPVGRLRYRHLRSVRGMHDHGVHTLWFIISAGEQRRYGVQVHGVPVVLEGGRCR